MTDDQIKSLRDDITYMKALADEGSRGPLLGGAILVAAGLIFAPASIVHWMIDTQVLAVGPEAYGYLGIAAVVIFLAALFVLKSRLGSRPGAFSPANRASSTAWMGVGLCCFVLGLSMAILAWRAGTEVPLLFFPSLITALYGAGWAVSAAMSRQKWLWVAAIGGWVAAPVLALLTGEPSQYLAYAAALVLLTIVPGVILMRQEPSDVV